EVPATAAGKLVINVKEGQTVSIGSVIGHIEPASAGDGAAKAQQPKETKSAEKPQAPREEKPAETPTAPTAKTAVDLSPAARQLAADAGLDASQLTGTGRGGRVRKEDVAAHLRQRARAESLEFPDTGAGSSVAVP